MEFLITDKLLKKTKMKKSMLLDMQEKAFAS